MFDLTERRSLHRLVLAISIFTVATPPALAQRPRVAWFGKGTAASLIAVSAVTDLRSRTMSLMRADGTLRAFASALAVSASGTK